MRPDPAPLPFACPVCGQALLDEGASARCGGGHGFDFARSGYLNLLAGGRPSGRLGDSAEMVRAREQFLGAGHFAPIAEAVAAAAVEALAVDGGGEAVGTAGPDPRAERGGRAAQVDRPAQASQTARAEWPQRTPLVAEIGCGTGYYLAAAVGALPERGHGGARGVGFDLAKAAAARAARLHPHLHFAVADVEERLPLPDGAADVALSVFAPRPAAELARVVGAGGLSTFPSTGDGNSTSPGALVVAFATPRHLEGLRERLGLLGVGEAKMERLCDRLHGAFELEDERTVEYEVRLGPEDAGRLVEMGPNARHGHSAATLDADHDDLVSVTVARFRRSG